MSFDATWRLKRQTFDPDELRNAVEDVARELGATRCEWQPGRDAEHLEAVLWLPAARVRAHDVLGLSKALGDADLLPAQLELSLEREGPGPLVVSELTFEEGELLIEMAFSADPARVAGGVAVGSTVFLLRHGTWQARTDSGLPDPEAGRVRCVRRGRDGEFWMGAEDGSLYREKRGEWTRFKVAAEGIDALCVVSPTRIFLSLVEGDLVEFDGATCVRRWPGLCAEQLVDTADGTFLFAKEELRRLDGGEWRKVRLPSEFALSSLAVDRHRRLWLGDSEAVFLFEGSQLIPTPVRCESLSAIAVHDENDLWAAGHGGEVVHWDGRSLARIECELPGFVALVTDGCGRAWVRGGRMFQVTRSSSVALRISSRRGANREAWGALAELCARVATRLGGYVVET